MNKFYLGALHDIDDFNLDYVFIFILLNFKFYKCIIWRIFSGLALLFLDSAFSIWQISYLLLMLLSIFDFLAHIFAYFRVFFYLLGASLSLEFHSIF